MQRLLLVAAVTFTVGVSAAVAAGLPGAKTASDRAAWRARLHWPAACEQSWKQAGTGGAGIVVWKLNSQVRLVEVSCSLGAYQGTEMLYVARTDDTPSIRRPPIALRIYEDNGSGKPVAKSRTLILGTMNFTLRTERLTVLDKFRGLGDCGIYSVFTTIDDRWIPIEARAKLACNGKGPFDPARWPKLPLPSG